jgi:hypothetical protein
MDGLPNYASSVAESGSPHTAGLKMPILFIYREVVQKVGF